MLDGASRIRDLISFAKAENMPGIALTDHGVMYGAIKFYNRSAYTSEVRNALLMWDDHVVRVLVEGGERKVIPYTPAIAT